MRPIAYEIAPDGSRIPAACWYILHKNYFSFGVRRSRSEDMLVIDPILNFSSSADGWGVDAVRAMRSDSDGNVYMAGESDSPEVSMPPGSAPRVLHRNGWIMKLDRIGQILYRVFISGQGNDVVNAI